MLVTSLAIILPRHLKTVGPWSDSAGAQAPLHLCCSFGGSHETNSFFARQWPFKNAFFLLNQHEMSIIVLENKPKINDIASMTRTLIARSSHLVELNL